MIKDLIWATLFFLLGLWLSYDNISHWHRKDLDSMMPGRKYVASFGSLLLIVIGVLYFLDTLGVLH